MAIPLPAESSAAAVERGMREAAVFEHRGISIPYSELPDSESNLLFGNVLWPCAEIVARLLIDELKGSAKVWTPDVAQQMGVPLELLLQRRFGLADVPKIPLPGACERLNLASVIPRLASDPPPSVLEVGAGVGVAGLACHACGARVLITDGEERLIKALRAKHQGTETLRFDVLDWRQDELASDAEGGECEQFDLILGCELLNPACEGEVHVPRLISRRLRRAPGARAVLLAEVRHPETCTKAVEALLASGLLVAAFQVCNGRELFEVPTDSLPAVGAVLLLVAVWPSRLCI